MTELVVLMGEGGVDQGASSGGEMIGYIGSYVMKWGALALKFGFELHREDEGGKHDIGPGVIKQSAA